MIVYIITDMEGLSGVDHWDQCYHPDDDDQGYRHGLKQLAADVNAAILGCVKAGASEVRVIDGHGRNRQKGLSPEDLLSPATMCFIEPASPLRLPEFGPEVGAVLLIGQHSMAGTLNGFLDHTQDPKTICRFMLNGQEHGELSQAALYAGYYGVPVVYASGDEALCEEAQNYFPWMTTTATKRGTGWSTCDLYPAGEVRDSISRDVAKALGKATLCPAWTLPLPVSVEIEWAWSGCADELAAIPHVERVHARIVKWQIKDPRDIYAVPSKSWTPPSSDGQPQ